jgi:hydroxylaminobenzene mutase
MSTADRCRTLMFSGFLLFLLALVTGLFFNKLPNPRLGQGAHITGLMNGMFLVLLGLSWDHLRLTARAGAWVVRLILFGTYANWGFSLLAAVLKTGNLTPLASGGQTADPWKEAIVGAGLISLTLCMLAAVGMIVWSLRKPAADAEPAVVREARSASVTR